MQRLHVCGGGFEDKSEVVPFRAENCLFRRAEGMTGEGIDVLCDAKRMAERTDH